ncbi:acetyltransferase [Pedobacter frigoris]|uniref:Acetyltransferase n=1 Tax=Pedobacter frigoris TaxID=2571272 RepID=A0A4U1CFT4_9SPHI|nr:acetyltransferase [Pedobacter frigoris]TKC05283.1 acetyltransferase [Pedobacter frigoris]
MHIIGAGGHAKVIVEIILESNFKIEGIWDENPDLIEFMGYPVNGNFKSFMEKIIPNEAIIAIGNNGIRKKLGEQLSNNKGVAIHKSSVVSSSASINFGTVIMANATINAHATIGKYAIINTNASIDHDCHLGDYVHVSPQAGLGGNVTVGEGTHIGLGSSIIQGITIGKWATIGAGAVIINDIPDYAVVVGNPGRIIKYNKRHDEQ